MSRQNSRHDGIVEEPPPWYVMTDNGLKFRPGVLAAHLATTYHVIYAGEQYYL